MAAKFILGIQGSVTAYVNVTAVIETISEVKKFDIKHPSESLSNIGSKVRQIDASVNVEARGSAGLSGTLITDGEVVAPGPEYYISYPQFGLARGSVLDQRSFNMIRPSNVPINLVVAPLQEPGHGIGGSATLDFKPGEGGLTSGSVGGVYGQGVDFSADVVTVSDYLVYGNIIDGFQGHVPIFNLDFRNMFLDQFRQQVQEWRDFFR